MEAELDTLLESGNFEAVAKVLDEHELDRASVTANIDQSDENANDRWPYSLHMLGHMVNSDLENARFVWKRAPETRRSNDEELKAVFALLQSMWNGDYPATHHRAAGSAVWSPKLLPMVQYLTAKYRVKTLELLTAAYTTVSVAHIAACLGASEEEAKATAKSVGWELMDAGTGGGGGGEGMFFNVVKPPAEEISLAPLESLQKLTEYTVHLGDVSGAGDKEA